MSPLIDSLSIIIVTYHGDMLLKNCLDSLFKVYGKRLEVIVVDNAAMPSTANIVRSYNIGVKYLVSKTNLGFAGGNNLGLKKATRPYLLLLNNDTIIHGDSFSPMLEFLATHDKVGIVQGTMNIPRLNNGLDVCGEDLYPWGLLRHRNYSKPTATTPLKPKKVFAAKGAMMMIKRYVIDELGGELFDASFKNYFEDIDLCFRAKKRGYATWFIPTLPIDHLNGQTSTHFNQTEIWAQYIRNILVSYHRNFGILGHIFVIPVFILAALVAKPRAFFNALHLCKCDKK